MAHRPNDKNKIPGWLIFVGFCIGFWPGGILLAIRLIQNAGERDNGRPRVSDAEWERLRQQAAESSGQRTVDAQGRRTYTPAADGTEGQPATAARGQVNSDGTYRYVYRSGSDTRQERARPASEPRRAHGGSSAEPQTGQKAASGGQCHPGRGRFCNGAGVSGLPV